jgi:hypothetical protein
MRYAHLAPDDAQAGVAALDQALQRSKNVVTDVKKTAKSGKKLTISLRTKEAIALIYMQFTKAMRCHTAEVTGSIPVAPTNFSLRYCLNPYSSVKWSPGAISAPSISP